MRNLRKLPGWAGLDTDILVAVCASITEHIPCAPKGSLQQEPPRESPTGVNPHSTEHKIDSYTKCVWIMGGCQWVRLLRLAFALGPITV